MSHYGRGTSDSKVTPDWRVTILTTSPLLQVTMLINHAVESRNENITVVFHGLDDFRPEKVSMFRIRGDVREVSRIYSEKLVAASKKLYKVPKVRKLYERRKDFDLIIVFHMMNEVGNQ